MNPAELPIHSALPELKAALFRHGTAILRADPGAGKSTVVPLELMEEPWLAGKKVLLLEPRRLAARMVATRMAESLKEAPGVRVGYRMRGEVRCTPRTRIEVITEGLLMRRLRSDPALEDVGLVIFDEVHERSLSSDLGLALTLQSRELFREDLRLLAMSATLEIDALREVLGPKTPVIESPGRCYEVSLRHLPPHSPLPTPRELPQALAETILKALDEQEGSVLAFLPGAAEIRRCERFLTSRLGPDVSLSPLYGDLSSREQRRALLPAPEGRRKVVLATNIAETSLTIEGIRIVVDGGYARQLRYDAARGMDRLRTLPIAADSAAQRAGRAGRTAPGVCYRLWSASRPLAPRTTPEILRADLAPLLLELYAWGSEPRELRWIDPPPAHAIESARTLLLKLEMITPSGSLTETGERALELGEHPRIAQMLLRGSEEGLGYEAALLAAILGERPPLESSNLSFALETIHERLRRGDPSLERLRRSLERYGRLLGIAPGPTVDHRAAGILLALAYPERIALRREERGRYRSAGGRGFRLRPEDSLGRYELFCVAETGGEGSEETIRLAAALSRQEELKAFGLINEREELRFDEAGGRVEARRIFECASLVLESRPLPLPKGPAVARMLLDGIRRRGAQALVWSQEAKNLLLRVRCIRRHLGESWPDWSDERLLERLDPG